MATINLPLDWRADHFITDNKEVLPPIPLADAEGRILTLNQTGFMRIDLDPFTLAFIEAAKQSTIPVLEVGAAYGCVTQKVLKSNATVVANDIDIRHLLLLREQVDKTAWPRLYLNHASFPQQTHFPKACFSHIFENRTLFIS